MRRKLTILVVVAIGVVVTVALMIPMMVEPSNCSAKNACIANLKQIDGAKATWALEKNKVNSDEPSATDLYGSMAYIRDVPVCENGGGTYTIGKVGERPRCSIPHHSLELGDVYVFDESNEPLWEATVRVQGAVSNVRSRQGAGNWFEPGTWDTTGTNGLARVDDYAQGATGFAAFKPGYTTSSVPLTTTWPAKLVLKKQPQ